MSLYKDSEPSNTWNITDSRGDTVGRVDGETFDEAYTTASQMTVVRQLLKEHLGFGLRRLTVNELHSS